MLAPGLTILVVVTRRNLDDECPSVVVNSSLPSSSPIQRPLDTAASQSAHERTNFRSKRFAL